MANKQKRYYKVGENVFVKADKSFGVIKGLNVNPTSNIYKATVEVTKSVDGGVHISTKELDLWEIDKDKRVLRKKGKSLPVGLNKAYSQVRAFHKSFGHPVKDVPTRIDAERALARAEWMKEEIQEFLDSLTVVNQADAMIDLIYFAIGTMVEMGVKPDRLFDIVQEANMSKLHNIGGEMLPVFRADGKVVKPEGWVAPEPLLEAEISRQSEIN